MRAAPRVRHRQRPGGPSQAVRSCLSPRHSLPRGLAVPGGGQWATCSFQAACWSERGAGARGAEGPSCWLPTVSAGDIRGARVAPRRAQGSPVHGHRLYMVTWGTTRCLLRCGSCLATWEYRSEQTAGCPVPQEPRWAHTCGGAQSVGGGAPRGPSRLAPSAPASLHGPQSFEGGPHGASRPPVTRGSRRRGPMREGGSDLANE